MEALNSGTEEQFVCNEVVQATMYNALLSIEYCIQYSKPIVRLRATARTQLRKARAEQPLHKQMRNSIAAIVLFESKKKRRNNFFRV